MLNFLKRAWSKCIKIVTLNISIFKPIRTHFLTFFHYAFMLLKGYIEYILTINSKWKLHLILYKLLSALNALFLELQYSRGMTASLTISKCVFFFKFLNNAEGPLNVLLFIHKKARKYTRNTKCFNQMMITIFLASKRHCFHCKRAIKYYKSLPALPNLLCHHRYLYLIT